jgi:hypothetical protein
MPIYELHEVTSVGDSANIDLNNTKSTTYTEYSKNDQGTFTIDKNIDLSITRRIFNLNVAKTSQSKFNQVIDINFEEFVGNVNDPTKFLENKLQMLEETRAKLLAEANSDKDLINRLQAEIDRLRAVNVVSDTLNSRQVLYADRDGSYGAPGYPNIENKLLSKNRKAIAIIQPDGNFVIYLGNFDEFGNEIRDPNEPSRLTPVIAFGYNNGTATAGFKIQIIKGKGNIIVFRLGDKTYWEAFPGSSIDLSYAAKVVLDDDGILTLYDGTVKKWSSIDVPITNEVDAELERARTPRNLAQNPVTGQGFTTTTGSANPNTNPFPVTGSGSTGPGSDEPTQIIRRGG